MPSLELEASNQSNNEDSICADPPTMLNLEEINMSEEDLIRSYDPNNMENNYHMPHHLVKKLQLDTHRPVCSEVIKNSLFISSHVVASDIESLRRHGITHIVNVAADVCTNHFVGQFQYLTYYLKDANNEDISLHFYRTLTWMDDAMQNGGRVLVHCREGVSRSSTMVIAYLMWRYSIRFEQAHDRIRRVRPICNPNTGFTCQLLVLGKHLGLTGNGTQTPPSDSVAVFRVAPYHPMEPFLQLCPALGAHWSSSPSFDPRFGWMVQRGLDAMLWIGAQVIDVEATHSAVKQHLAWLQSFERIDVRLSVVQDGLETPQFWQLLGLPGTPTATGRLQFTATRPAFDADAEILANSQGAGILPVVANDVEISSAREAGAPRSLRTTEAGEISSAREAGAPRSLRTTEAGTPRTQVPSLNLGGMSARGAEVPSLNLGGVSARGAFVPSLNLGGLHLAKPPVSVQ